VGRTVEAAPVAGGGEWLTVGGVEAGGGNGCLPSGAYNIPGCEARNREETEVCIAFMHRKSGEFSRF
jgi:hypothetical protein